MHHGLSLTDGDLICLRAEQEAGPLRERLPGERLVEPSAVHDQRGGFLGSDSEGLARSRDEARTRQLGLHALTVEVEPLVHLDADHAGAVDRLTDFRMLLEDEHLVAQPHQLSRGIGASGPTADDDNIMHGRESLLRYGHGGRDV